MAMTQTLTDWLQQSRVMVVEVDRQQGRLRVKGETCSDLSCHEQTLVIDEDGVEAPVDTLNPGDIVRIEAGAAGVARIAVLRRVWEQIASPEL
jgi:flagella basal body P-ring formation protein FlgA